MLFTNNSRILLYAVLFPLTSFSQMSLEVGAHTLTGFSKSASFNTYREQYNVNNAATLKNELNKSGINYGYGATVAFKVNKFYSAFDVTNAYSGAVAKFSNDASRHFNFHNRYYNMLVGFNLSRATSEITLATGLNVSDYFITTHVRYPNGERDYTYGTVYGSNHAVGIGVPVMVEYSASLGGRWNFYTRVQLQFSTRDEFIFSGNTGSMVYPDGEIVNDRFRGLLIFGIKRSFSL